MERLTKKDQVAGNEINYVDGDHCFELWSIPKKFMGVAIDRLAAYEDTGLEPEEVMALAVAEEKRKARLADMQVGKTLDGVPVGVVLPKLDMEGGNG